MKAILPVFIKVLVKEFYRINAGFFLIVVGLCFGFLRGVEHIALAQYFIGSPFLLLIPISVWFLFALKIASFNSLALKKQENGFVHAAALIKPPLLLAYMAMITIQQFMPALLYGVFLILMAIKFQQGTVVVEVLASFFAFVTLMSVTLYRRIINPDAGKSVNYLNRRMNRLFTRPYSLFYPEWITGQQPVLFFGTKVLACLLLIGISRLYLFDTYDERLFQMGCVLAFSFNLAIVFFYQKFANSNFSLLRSLPISLERRLGHFIVIITLLQLPEIGIMINYFPSGISLLHLASSIVFGLSISVLGYTSLYVKDLTMDIFIQRIFVSAMVFIVLVLFKVPAIILTILQFTFAHWLYRKYYYKFEINAEHQ